MKYLLAGDGQEELYDLEEDPLELHNLAEQRSADCARLRRMLEEMRDRARLCLAAVDDALEGQGYLVGDEFTAADIMMGYSVLLARWQGAMDEGEFSNVDAYADRLKARPAFARTMA